MAIYEFLPVYKTSYDFLLAIFQFTKNFDREFKYTIGEEIKKETLALMTNIYRANSSRSKFALIQSARENLEVIRLYLRLLKDLKQVNLDRYVALNELIESVSKQLCAWQKSMGDSSLHNQKNILRVQKEKAPTEDGTSSGSFS